MSVIPVEIICTQPNLLSIHFLKNENLIKILNTYLIIDALLSLSPFLRISHTLWVKMPLALFIWYFSFSLIEIGITVLVLSTIEDGD